MMLPDSWVNDGRAVGHVTDPARVHRPRVDAAALSATVKIVDAPDPTQPRSDESADVTVKMS